jgi:micrococcal nuclease
MRRTLLGTIVLAAACLTACTTQPNAPSTISPVTIGGGPNTPQIITSDTPPSVTAEPDGPFPPSSEAAPIPVTSAPLNDNPGFEVQVARVIDGDTFVTQAGATIRVLGLDAPETQNGHHDCYGQEATEMAKQLLMGSDILSVTLTADPKQGDKDRYGRYLRYVDTTSSKFNPADFASTMITVGYGRNYTKYPVTRSAEYARDEDTARTIQAGGWAAAPQGCGWTK